MKVSQVQMNFYIYIYIKTYHKLWYNVCGFYTLKGQEL